MTEFEKQMMAMLQKINDEISGLKQDVSGLKQDVSGLKQGQEEIKERLGRLEAKVDDNFATVVDGVATIAEALGDEQINQTKRMDVVEGVVSRSLFDIAALKQKVG